MTDIFTDCLTWVVGGQTLAMNDQLALGPVVGDPTQVFTLVQGTAIQYLTVASKPGMALSWQDMTWGTVWDDTSSAQSTWYQAATATEPAAFFSGWSGATQMWQPNTAGSAVVMGPLPAGMTLTTPPAYTPPSTAPTPSAYVPAGFTYWGGDEMMSGFDYTKWWTLYANPSTAHSIPSNGEIEYYDVNGNHVAIPGGGVALTAYPPGGDGLYHSGMMRWKEVANIASPTTSFYFEISMQIPDAQGSWPAFWCGGEPTNPDGVGPWPPEMDFAEFMINAANGDTSFMLGANVQYNNNDPGPWSGPNSNWSYGTPPPSGWVWSDSGRTKWTTPIDFSAGYHTYGVLWEPGQAGVNINPETGEPTHMVYYYFDGYNYFNAPYDAFVGADGTKPYGLEILINLAVGGVGGGTPDPTKFPCAFNIKYFRAYTMNGASDGSDFATSTQGTDQTPGANGW
jgi:beta-glucanase (GH16 family)